MSDLEKVVAAKNNLEYESKKEGVPLKQLIDNIVSNIKLNPLSSVPEVDSDKTPKHISIHHSITGMHDTIKPNHYKKNGMDLIDNFKNLFDEKEFRAVMKSNIFRYVVRYEEKNGIQDLFKAIEFAERLIEWEESLE